jgi:hypothetical protein
MSSTARWTDQKGLGPKWFAHVVKSLGEQFWGDMLHAVCSPRSKSALRTASVKEADMLQKADWLHRSPARRSNIFRMWRASITRG